MSGTRVRISEQERLLVFPSRRKWAGFQELSAGTGAESCVLSVILQSLPPAASPGVQGLGEMTLASPVNGQRLDKASDRIYPPEVYFSRPVEWTGCACLALTQRSSFRASANIRHMVTSLQQRPQGGPRAACSLRPLHPQAPAGPPTRCGFPKFLVMAAHRLAGP